MFPSNPLPTKDLGPSSPGQCHIGNPCNPATGNKYLSELDYAGSLLSLSLTRHYNSLLNKDLGMGFGWSTPFHKRMELQGSVVQVRAGDGRGESFSCVNNICTGESDSELALTQDTTGYTLTLRDKSAERYDLNGKLLSVTNSSDQITTNGYDGSGRLATVTGPFGHTLTFGHDINNRFATVTHPTGHTIQYSYDTKGNLARVDYPDSTAKLYHYENTTYPYYLTGISYVDALSNVTRYASYAYYYNNSFSAAAINDLNNGKANLTQHAQTDNGSPQEKFTLAHGVPAVNQTTVTDAIGTQEIMTFATNLGVKNLTSKVNQSDGKSLQQSFDGNNSLTCRKDEEGRVTSYTYNATNQRTGMTEGLTGNCTSPVPVAGVTRTTSYGYHSPTLDLPTLITSPGVYSGQNKTTTIQYTDASHPNLLTQITQRGYTPSGTVVSRAVTLGYNSYGQVISINGPRTDVTDVTTLEYYDCTTGGACGQLKKITNVLGHITTYDLYDANGRVTQVTDPNGLVTTYSYDARGRVKTIRRTPVSGAYAETQYSYTPWGDVGQVIDPDGVVLNYQYDAAHDLRFIVDAAGNYIHYTYDLKGNRTGESVYDNAGVLKRTLSQTYDLRNHLSSITAAGNVTQLVFDAVGNLLSESPNADGVNRTMQHQYDALNRLMQTVDAQNGVTGYASDTNDRLKQATAPNNLSTQYQYDDLGNLLKEISPDRGATNYTYDDAGNALTVKDARGKVTSYTYDALNRATEQRNNDTATPRYNYTYDECGAGRLCNVWQDNNTHLILNYDGLGRRSYVLDDNWLYTLYTYTPGGRLTQIVYPDGRSVDYQYDTRGNVTQVSTAAGTTTVLTRNFVYHPFGPLKSLAYGNGKTRNAWRDTAYRPTFRSDGPYFQNITGYDGADNISQLYAPGLKSFGYDALDRLSTATDNASGSYGSLSWLYDGNGNRSSETRNGTTTSYIYSPAGSNWLYNPAAGDYRIRSADGATLSTTALGLLSRDGYARLTAAAKPGAAYDYNALNQRTRKTVGGVTTAFHYGPEGELLYETDSTGAKAYVYLHNAPLARIDNGTTIYYYHTDHLGTPQRMTNSSGTVVWKANYEPFGKATVTVNAITNNLRLAGQYFDSETGLHYNWNRYFDPKIGRYITSDPIGLKGGLNTYAYVANNPLRWIDPNGLEIALQWHFVASDRYHTLLRGGCKKVCVNGHLAGDCHPTRRNHDRREQGITPRTDRPPARQLQEA